MSYLATVLDELRAQRKLNQSAISKLSGIPQPQISRWINGEQSWISNDDLEKLSRTVFSKRHEQAQLLRARLMDLCIGPGADIIHISIAHEEKHLAEDSPAYRVKLPPKDEAAVELIRATMSTDRRLRDMVLSLANYCKPKSKI